MALDMLTGALTPTRVSLSVSLLLVRVLAVFVSDRRSIYPNDALELASIALHWIPAPK